MTLLQLQGLLYLVSGSFAFFALATGFRLYSYRSRSGGAAHLADGGADFMRDPWMDIEELEVVKIISESEDIKSFRLSRLSGLKFPGTIRGGQFLSFQIGDDSSVTRSYSLSGLSPTGAYLQVSVKLIKDGIGSSWFHSLVEGDRVKAYPASGHFVDHFPTHCKRVYVAGGVGITPYISMLEQHFSVAQPPEIHLFYGARKKKDLIYHHYLLHHSRSSSSFHYHPILSMEESQPEAPSQGHMTRDIILSGHITWDRIKELAGLSSGSESSSIKHTSLQHSGSVFYLCGPPPMTNALLPHIDAYVADEEQVVTEKFVSPTSIDISSFPEVTARVTSQGGRDLSYQGRTDLLSFLEAQGEGLPFACRSGVCGSCRCRIDGEYFQLTDAGLTRREQKDGWALACVSYPRGDISVNLA